MTIPAIALIALGWATVAYVCVAAWRRFCARRPQAAQRYTLDVTLPVPILETPQITYRGPEVQDTFCNAPMEKTP